MSWQKVDWERLLFDFVGINIPRASREYCKAARAVMPCHGLFGMDNANTSVLLKCSDLVWK